MNVMKPPWFDQIRGVLADVEALHTQNCVDAFIDGWSSSERRRWDAIMAWLHDPTNRAGVERWINGIPIRQYPQHQVNEVLRVLWVSDALAIREGREEAESGVKSRYELERSVRRAWILLGKEYPELMRIAEEFSECKCFEGKILERLRCLNVDRLREIRQVHERMARDHGNEAVARWLDSHEPANSLVRCVVENALLVLDFISAWEP